MSGGGAVPQGGPGGPGQMALVMYVHSATAVVMSPVQFVTEALTLVIVDASGGASRWHVSEAESGAKARDPSNWGFPVMTKLSSPTKYCICSRPARVVSSWLFWITSDTGG